MVTYSGGYSSPRSGPCAACNQPYVLYGSHWKVSACLETHLKDESSRCGAVANLYTVAAYRRRLCLYLYISRHRSGLLVLLSIIHTMESCKRTYRQEGIAVLHLRRFFHLGVSVVSVNCITIHWLTYI